VTSVLLADLVTIAAHFYADAHPESKTARPFEAIMLLTGCVLGVVSLALLAVVWRVSRLKPPRGFVVFAALVAAAPIVVTVARLNMR
jgi:predicted membrane-bound mannosyltransferase